MALSPEYSSDMPKISVEVAAELLDDIDKHVGEDGSRQPERGYPRLGTKDPYMLDDIDKRQGRLDDDQ